MAATVRPRSSTSRSRSSGPAGGASWRRSNGKPGIEVAPPPEFRGVDPTTWSPEDFFVGAAASCLAVTFTGLAERAGLSYRSLEVHGDGVVGRA